MKIALIIGHSSTSQGASNKKAKLTEFNYNKGLVADIKNSLVSSGHKDVQIVYRKTYEELPKQVNALKPDIVVSFHCNAYNETASGTEVLYWHKSVKGKKIATIFQKELLKALKLPNRGIKPKTSEDRGGYILRHTEAPCIILEPFFIDNDADLAIAQREHKAIVGAITTAFEKIKSLFKPDPS